MRTMEQARERKIMLPVFLLVATGKHLLHTLEQVMRDHRFVVPLYSTPCQTKNPR